MEDLLKALGEFVVEAIGHFLIGLAEHGLQQCRPRLAVGIVLSVLPLIAILVLGVVVQDSGLSPQTAIVGGFMVAILASPSAYCFRTMRLND